MKRSITSETTITSLILFIGLANFSARADAYISVSASGFWPSDVTVAVGEAVIWMAEDDMGPYSISSPKGYWSAIYLYDEGDMDGLQFTQTGDYAYFDALSGNQGVVHVRNGTPNNPPVVAITKPAEGAVFTAPATFQFSCDASDSDDGLLMVEFYVGGNLIDQIFSSPYTTTVTNLSSGSYVLMATAYDVAGATATHQVNITVQTGSASAVSISAPRLVAGQFQFEVSGLPIGKKVTIQSASRLSTSANWVTVLTKTADADSLSFSVPVAEGCQFFRCIVSDAADLTAAVQAWSNAHPGAIFALYAGDSIMMGYPSFCSAQNNGGPATGNPDGDIAHRVSVDSGGYVPGLNVGVSGAVLFYISFWEIQQKVATLRPKYVFFEGGINDLEGGTLTWPVSQYNGARAACVAQGAKLICTEIWPHNSLGTLIASWNASIANWISTNAGGTYLLPTHTWMADPANTNRILPAYTCDGQHPSLAGTERWAQQMLHFLYGLEGTNTFAAL